MERPRSPRRHPRPTTLLVAVVASAVLLALTLVAFVNRDRLADVRDALDPRPVAVFIGDSYTAGAGTSDPARAAPYLIAQHQGWRAVILAMGGTGYITAVEPGLKACGLDRCPSYTDMIPAAVAERPDVIVVNGGRNEVERSRDPTWSLAVATFFAELRRLVPNATIVATSPIWDDEPAPPEIAMMCDVVEQAVEAVEGIYVDLGEPLVGRPDLLAADGVHPNDAGNAAIAAVFNAAYASDA